MALVVPVAPVRPWVGLLLACVCGLAGAEPVVNPALAPADMSKLLQAPQVGVGPGAGVGENARTWLPKTEFGLHGAAQGGDWNAGAQAAVEGAAESGTEPKPRAQAPAESRGKDPRADAPAAGAKPGPAHSRPLPVDDGLFGEALRELHDSSEFRDLKELWRDANAEVNRFKGGFLFDTPSEEELAQRRSARERVDGPGGATGYGGGAANSSYRPRSAAELERDDILISVMIKRMIDEITPWAIGLVLSLLILRLGLGYWRAQSRQLDRAQMGGGRGGSAYRP